MFFLVLKPLPNDSLSNCPGRKRTPKRGIAVTAPNTVRDPKEQKVGRD
jgi:hypothetical protein